MSQNASAGNRGLKIRSDCFVQIELTGGGGITVNLKSKVDRMFGNQIRQQVHEVLSTLGISNASVEVEDTGALPFVISARIEAAVRQLQPTGRSFRHFLSFGPW